MVKQYNIYWVDLDPTKGSEIQKKRPCVVISPNVSNKLLRTVLIAPVTSTLRGLPMRVKSKVDGREGEICLDQIRCVDKTRLIKKIESLPKYKGQELKEVLKEYLVD